MKCSVHGEIEGKRCKICETERRRRWHLANKEKIAQKRREYNLRNKDTIKEKQRIYHIQNKERHNQHMRERYANNREVEKEYKKKYDKINADKIRERKRKYQLKKRKTDLDYRILTTMRARVSNMVSGKSNKYHKTLELLGCSIEELKIYLESKFQPGMTWDNYGRYGWHIDHIHPVGKLVLTDPEQLKKACHYTNLQPLWAKDNLSKGAKIIEQPPPSK